MDQIITARYNFYVESVFSPDEGLTDNVPASCWVTEVPSPATEQATYNNSLLPLASLEGLHQSFANESKFQAALLLQPRPQRSSDKIRHYYSQRLIGEFVEITLIETSVNTVLIQPTIKRRVC
ncbi:hypothetical protein J6590_086395 [Homalodisca vitripennis]|nr:hypothetical protein J6590_086395 [Homalodisca vitripennis]